MIAVTPENTTDFSTIRLSVNTSTLPVNVLTEYDEEAGGKLIAGSI